MTIMIDDAIERLQAALARAGVPPPTDPITQAQAVSVPVGPSPGAVIATTLRPGVHPSAIWGLRWNRSALYLTMMLSVASQRTSQDLDLLFGALADATRRGIVERLAEGEATVTELAAPYSISLPAISRHLKVLERASLITRSQQGRWRSARLSPNSLASAAAWLARSERKWIKSFGRLDEHLARLTAEQAAASAQAKKTTRPQKKRGTP